MKNIVNEQLKSLRESRGYSYQDMADILHVSKSFYWQIEHGNRRLKYDLAKRIAAVFELKPDDVFYEAETK